MAKDKHLGTGEYDQSKYWNARAKHSNQEYFDAVCVFGATRDENETAHKVQVSALSKALKYIDLYGAKVLEYGCGIGRWISYFQQKGCMWHGVDISEEMLSIAKKANRNVTLNKTVENQIPYPSKSMDFVYSITVVHHNPYEVQDKIISEMIRVIKKSGYLLLLEDLGKRGQFNMFPRTLTSWISLVEKHGMEYLWQSNLGYWFIRNSMLGFIKRLYLFKNTSGDKQNICDTDNIFVPTLLMKLTNKADLIIDPYIWEHVPKRFKNSAIMLFKK